MPIAINVTIQTGRKSRIAMSNPEVYFKNLLSSSLKDASIIPDDLVLEFCQPKPYAAKVALLWTPDYTLTTFELAKALKTNAVELATRAASILSRQDFIERAESVGPYINFRVDITFLKAQLDRLSSENEDTVSTKSERKGVVIDFGRPRLGSALSWANLAAIIRGESIARILETTGYTVTRNFRLRDWGVPVAEYIAGLGTYNAGLVYDPSSLRHSRRAVLPARKVRQIIHDIETEGSSVHDVWKLSRQSWMEYLRDVLDAMNYQMEFGHSDFELKSQAAACIRLLAEEYPDVYRIDEDSQAVYVEGDLISPLYTHDGHATELGLDIVSMYLHTNNNPPELLIHMPSERTTSIQDIAYTIAKDVFDITVIQPIPHALTPRGDAFVSSQDIRAIAAQPNGLSNLKWSLLGGKQETLADLLSDIKKQDMGNGKRQERISRSRHADVNDSFRAMALHLLEHGNAVQEAAGSFDPGILQSYLSKAVALYASYRDSTDGDDFEQLISKAFRKVTENTLSLLAIH